MTMEALPQDLADFLVTRNFDPEYFDDKGQPAEAGDAKTMKFDYVASSGKNYGTAVCVVADNELSLFYGDNLGRGMEPEDKQDWFSFLEQLSNTAASHSATWSPRDINQLKHTLAGIAAIKEGLFEGYYGTRKISYMGEQTQARLVIKHNRVLGEDDKRYRYVESLFIETAEQERFRLPFKSLSAGRAMLEHVRSGGRPYDVRGNHITEVVSEMAVLSRFNRAQHHRVYERVTQELVESAQQYYRNLQETMKHLGSPRGYQAYFESWAPDQTGEAEALVENLRDLFVEQTLDARIEAALPTLAKIQQQGNNMKEAEIFESWINQLSEGTWALPDTPETQEKLNQLMSAELIVGPDATNATELLYDLVGDDELFDILNDLADKSQGRANIWDDSDVQRRLAELGVQTPQSTETAPADVPQDTAPAVAEGSGDPQITPGMKTQYGTVVSVKGNTVTVRASNGELTTVNIHDIDQGMAEGSLNEGQYEMMMRNGQVKKFIAKDDADAKRIAAGHGAKSVIKLRGGVPAGKVSEQGMAEGSELKQAKRKYNQAAKDANADQVGAGKKIDTMKKSLRQKDVAKQDMAEGDNLSTFEQDAELAEMLKYAGVPIKENVLTDSTGSTLDHIQNTFKRDVKDFTQSGDMSDALYDALYDYYFDDMPYGTKKARDGDPHEWISDRFAQDIGLDEGWKGALTGAALGGALGSIVPGLGTIQGAIAGGYAGHRLGDEGLADPDKEYNQRQAQQQKPVSEGSCNMTMEGEYCPEHGLAECGSMYETQAPHPKELEMDALVRSMQIQNRADGAEKRLAQRAAEPHTLGQKIKQDIGNPLGKLFKGDIKGALGEADDGEVVLPLNMVEEVAFKSQEGDALLARIKSLALLR